jgi:hypothetical protein
VAVVTGRIGDREEEEQRRRRRNIKRARRPIIPGAHDKEEKRKREREREEEKGKKKNKSGTAAEGGKRRQREAAEGSGTYCQDRPDAEALADVKMAHHCPIGAGDMA